MKRIERTATHPAANGGRNDFVGYGTIDPEAALTAVLPGETPPAPAQRYGPQTLPAAQPHPTPNTTPGWCRCSARSASWSRSSSAPSSRSRGAAAQTDLLPRGRRAQPDELAPGLTVDVGSDFAETPVCG